MYLGDTVYHGAFYGAGELVDSLEPTTIDLSKHDMEVLTNREGGMPMALVDLAGRIGKPLATIINLVDV